MAPRRRAVQYLKCRQIGGLGGYPPGFVLSQSSNSDRGEALTYTDGIASFTVFIEPIADTAVFKQGVARRGATVALMAIMPLLGNPFGVVLVGEVPVATAQQVVAAIGPQISGSN